jgi:hypothetical protein
MAKPRTVIGKARRISVQLSAIDWRDVYEALMDAANQYHSGPRAERTLAIARKIREAAL